MTNHANCIHPKTAAARAACRRNNVPTPARIQVVVTREAYCDTPDQVLIVRDDDVQGTIRAHYGDVAFDTCGGFDTKDGGSFVYDAMTAR